eukprot:1043324-Prymnesium_polylepis.1
MSVSHHCLTRTPAAACEGHRRPMEAANGDRGPYAQSRGPCVRRRVRRAAQKIRGRPPAASRRPLSREDFVVVDGGGSAEERDRPTCERRARDARGWSGRTPCCGGEHDAAQYARCAA